MNKRYIKAFENILKRLGFEAEEDRARSPERFLKVIEHFMQNEKKGVPDFEITTFPVKYNNRIEVNKIITWSSCEHHLLPFKNEIDVVYIPSGKVLGLSKIPRIVDFFSTQYTSAEKLVTRIADFILNIEKLNPKYVKVTCKSYHTYCGARGVGKEVEMITTAERGK